MSERGSAWRCFCTGWTSYPVYHQLFDQLAGAHRAVLLVLDNVGDPDQVTELLPRGVGGHRVLITSRDTLAALPQARLLDLHVLEPDAAVKLLTLGLHRRHPADARVTGDLGAASQLVELCGRLPLAVQIVAALLGDEPDRPLAELADELADEGHRLRGLVYGGRWADAGRVRPVLPAPFRPVTWSGRAVDGPAGSGLAR